LQADGGVDSDQSDGHGDDRPHQFAGAGNGGIKGAEAFPDMAFNILHHDNGVVHHQTNGEDDGQQGQQVDGEPEGLHEKDSANQGQGDGHHRDDD